MLGRERGATARGRRKADQNDHHLFFLSLCVIIANAGVKTEVAVAKTDQVHDFLAMPQGQTGDLPLAPKTVSQAVASAESKHGEMPPNAEFDGLINNNVWA